jgi:hypothetical protein
MGGAEQVGAGFAAAATAPLEDFNLRRQMIPTVLLQAEANPYDLRNLNQCTTIGAEVARLDEALGPDTDEPPRQDGSYLSERAADAAAKAALNAIRDTTTDFHSRPKLDSSTERRRTAFKARSVGHSSAPRRPDAPRLPEGHGHAAELRAAGGAQLVQTAKKEYLSPLGVSRFDVWRAWKSRRNCSNRPSEIAARMAAVSAW